MPGRIEDYALIGDLETASLVGLDGSIDWLCWPRFDSDACFAALLGDAEHGRWLLCAADSGVKVTRRYRENTLILETRLESDAGAATIIDFMPPRGNASDVIRLVIGERGELALYTELVIRFGYGDIVPWVTHVAPEQWQGRPASPAADGNGVGARHDRPVTRSLRFGDRPKKGGPEWTRLIFPN